MKTRKKRRVTFSTCEDGRRAVDVKLPDSWQQLSQDELRTVYDIMSMDGVTQSDVIVMVFFALTGARIERAHDERGRVQLVFPRRSGHGIRLRIDLYDITELMHPLDFLFEEYAAPVRLDTLAGCEAVDAALHGLPFGDYIRLENLYNGMIRTKDRSILGKIAAILYPGYDGELSPAEQLNVINWVVAAKGLLSRTFKNFFRPAGADGKEPDMLAVMNNEIRALSGGDPTKEAAVLELDCWRALTELDFKAKEAEEFDRRMKQNR